MKVIILGAGPAGLTLAHELATRGTEVEVFERESEIGGLARSLHFNGFAVDFAGHRWAQKHPRVRNFLIQHLHDDLLEQQRCHAILIHGRIYAHPFCLSEYLLSLPIVTRYRELGEIIALRVYRRLRSRQESFADWVMPEFGRLAYKDNIEPHYLKTTGLSPRELLPAYRNLFNEFKYTDLFRIAINQRRSIPEQRKFFYPRLGSGQVWQSIASKIKASGGRIHVGVNVFRLKTMRTGFVVSGRSSTGVEVEQSGQRVVSTIPLSDLASMIEPTPDSSILKHAASLRRTGLICVFFFIRRSRFLPCDTIYVPDPQIVFSHLEDLSYLSSRMAPEDCTSVLALVSVEDKIASLSDNSLQELVKQQMAQIGFPIADGDIVGSHVERVQDARPDPRPASRFSVSLLREFAKQRSITLLGRHGTGTPEFRMDDAVLAAMELAESEIFVV